MTYSISGGTLISAPSVTVSLTTLKWNDSHLIDPPIYVTYYFMHRIFNTN